MRQTRSRPRRSERGRRARPPPRRAQESGAASRPRSTSEPEPTGRRKGRNAVDVLAMAEQSHRDEMSAAIRAQRERAAAPRSIAPEPAVPTEPPAVPAPAEPERKRLFGRLRAK